MIQKNFRIPGIRASTSGASFIGILMAVAIILFLAAQYLKGANIAPSGARNAGTVTPIEQARAVQDLQKEKRIELAAEQFRIREGREHSSLQELIDANLLSSHDLE